MSKLNKIIFGLIVVFIVVFIVAAVTTLSPRLNIQDSSPQAKEIICTKNFPFGNDQVEKIIIDYLLTQEDFSWKTRTNSRNLCVIENLNPTKECLFPHYVWVRCGEFIIQNKMPKEVSGISLPAKINYPNELLYFDINKMSHEVPRSGLLYSEDIKTIFPLNVQKRIVDFDSKNINSRIEKIMVDWFRIKTNHKEPCVDLCGDGRCQKVVCMAIGCPCSETPKACPEDCK